MANQLNTLIILVIALMVSSCNTRESKVTEPEENKESTTVETKTLANEESGHLNQAPDTLAYCVNEGIGAGGYDLVNYFTQNQALKGNNDISTIFDGVEYVFTTTENRDIFSNDPEKYLPAYGGWCAMTLSMGRATTPVYDNFLIVDGKLHLFERTVSVNGRTLWQQDPVTNAQLAQKHYDDYKDDGVISVEE